ncbi:MAG: DUF455 family protein [Verrucomicrobia bacterium]|nr:DUF455 family protein [Verrucomicrobiota bacterium]
MELREFAERVLFSTTLEEKLRGEDDLSDERPGQPLASPTAPGRPPELRFRPAGISRPDFPGLAALERERERGRLLHFFANHELLATELMALALLKFPDAPPAFRRGVLKTLRDEQEHTRWYIERMRACGLAFGELPVSGYFWRCAAPMENPLDYVATLCLTFEQANLDFAGHFARGFARVGDAESARLLDRIYHDEIGHVAYGLKWFRRWKNPTESDWEAFCRVLRFPLSPQRAKGFAVNAAGRRAAGFDADFIAHLEVYAQSKGRTPNVHVFNPFTEARLAAGRSFQPTRHQADLQRDLANLPQFLCRQDDIVLVRERPAPAFLASLQEAGFPLPEFVEMGDAVVLPATTLAGRKLGVLRPWAWGPDSLELLRPLFGSVTGESRTPEQRFNPGIAELYSKAWSAALLRRLLTQPKPGDLSPAGIWEDEAWLCPPTTVGTVAKTLEEALAAIAAIRAHGHQQVMVKQAFSWAGHNALRLWEPEVTEPQRRWLERAVLAGRPLIVEPWLERVVDFSIQLEMSAKGLKLLGYTGLSNDHRGQYRGNWAESHHHRRPPSEVLDRLTGPPDIARRFHGLYTGLFALLEPALRAAGYLGPVGIDALVYRSTDGTCRLKPVVEINPRYTFGRLMVELMRHTAPGSRGELRLVNRAMAAAAGARDFVEYARRLRGISPVRLAGEPVPRLAAGAVCLNDPSRAKVCLAVFEVAPPVKRA